MDRHLRVIILEDFVLLHASFIYNFVDKSIKLDFVINLYEDLHSLAN